MFTIKIVAKVCRNKICLWCGILDSHTSGSQLLSLQQDDCCQWEVSNDHISSARTTVH